MLSSMGMRVVWLARTGWMQSGVPPSIAETVGQHTFLASLIAIDIMGMLKTKNGTIDEGRTLKMVLIHDLVEGVTGDIPKWSSNRIKKHELEEEALTSSNVPNEITELWRDYEKGKSLEAKVARLSDLLATLKMALYYKEKSFDVESIEESTRREATRLLNELDLELEI